MFFYKKVLTEFSARRAGLNLAVAGICLGEDAAPNNEAQ
jgi:hypothetical protein